MSARTLLLASIAYALLLSGCAAESDAEPPPRAEAAAYDAASSDCATMSWGTNAKDHTPWALQGDTRVDPLNGWLELTNDYTFQHGAAAWLDTPVQSRNFSVSFLAYLGDAEGADGMTLTIVRAGDPGTLKTDQGYMLGAEGFHG